LKKLRVLTTRDDNVLGMGKVRVSRTLQRGTRVSRESKWVESHIEQGKSQNEAYHYENLKKFANLSRTISNRYEKFAYSLKMRHKFFFISPIRFV